MKSNKIIKIISVFTFSATLTACATDKHAYNQNPQKIFAAVNSKYPTDKNTLVFIDAPTGFIANKLAIDTVDNNVDSGKVVAISSALALKTSTVIVAGENESLTASTLVKALASDKSKISGAKLIVIGANESRQKLTDLAAYSDVSIEFIDTPI